MNYSKPIEQRHFEKVKQGHDIPKQTATPAPKLKKPNDLEYRIEWKPSPLGEMRYSSAKEFILGATIFSDEDSARQAAETSLAKGTAPYKSYQIKGFEKGAFSRGRS